MIKRVIVWNTIINLLSSDLGRKREEGGKKTRRRGEKDGEKDKKKTRRRQEEDGDEDERRFKVSYVLK